MNPSRHPGKPKSLLLRCATTLLLVAMLSACGSSRKASRRGGDGYTQKEQTSRHDREGQATDRGLGQALAREARHWIGTPYRYGGHEKGRGTDCSGMVMEVYRRAAGISLPRSTTEQVAYCTEVACNRGPEVGDLVFFTSVASKKRRANGVSHVGLYVGSGQMIHASSSQGVIVSPIDTGYWGDRYLCAGRPPQIKGDRGEGAQSPAQPPSGVPEISLDRLDEIISQKTDSIFSSQYFE